jgi:predicted Zn-dependent protease
MSSGELYYVIEHELGIVVGLGHVQDPSRLMNPSD